MSVALTLYLGLRLSYSRRLGGIVILDVVCVALLTHVFFGVIGMDESFVSNEQITPGECLGTNVANEWFLFRVSANVALQMFLAQLSQWEASGSG